MWSIARQISNFRPDPARRWARWLLVALLPWLLSGLGESVLHSANCPDVIVLNHAVAQHHASESPAQPSAASQHLTADSAGSDEICLTSLWATQSVGMQVGTVPLSLVARATAPVLPPVFLVSGVALPRGCIIRGPPATEFSYPLV